ncbi:hypothetical protein, partial [Streptomyces kasugaensis]|uniref:hypothetical protein n=1 Tax=Streptomyces kasugaensis TaxID=1946 RepID=UPI001F5EB913
MQRRNRRRQITLAPGRASGQLTVDSGHVPLPQPEQSPNLVSDQEPPAVGARSPGAAAAASSCPAAASHRHTAR